MIAAATPNGRRQCRRMKSILNQSSRVTFFVLARGNLLECSQGKTSSSSVLEVSHTLDNLLGKESKVICVGSIAHT